MRIDVWSDIVCPWCYVGKARLEAALASFAHRAEVEVTYRSFELDPSWTGTEPVLEMLAVKYGLSAADAAQAEDRVAALARAEGLPYRTDRMRGNSFDAHRLVHFAGEHGLGARVLDLVFRAHFGGGRSVFDPEGLADLAAQAGLDRSEAVAVLASDRYAAEVRADEAAAGELGISGVPFFVFDEAFAVSGAQPTEVFVRALDQAWAASVANT